LHEAGWGCRARGSHTIRSLNGRRTIPDPALRDELTSTADGIKNDMKPLRRGVTCTRAAARASPPGL
jgi:hypothetical protein